MANLKGLEKKLKNIEERNKKVGLDKAWELSYSRRFLLSMFTYISIGVYLKAINVPKPWLNAIVPAIAFMLSTLTLPFFRKLWIAYKTR